MIVCHCKRVNDRRIREAIGNGACSRESIATACGAGTGCGGCLRAVDEILEAEQKSPNGLRVLSGPPLASAG